MSLETQHYTPEDKPFFVRKEYEKNFGNEVEDLMARFVAENFDFADGVEKASVFDDRKHKIDHIVFHDGRPFLALQETLSGSRDKQEEKIKYLMTEPIVELHDDTGKSTTKEKIPKVILWDDLTRWGDAFNKAKANDADPMTELPDKTEIKSKFLQQMVAALKAEAYFFPRFPQFEEALKIVEEEQKNSKKKAA
jgi:hypothetical protein